MDDQLKANLTSSEHWTRFVYMFLFSVFLYIASLLAVVIVVAQFVFALVTGGPNVRLRSFGGEVVTYINQAWLFLTYNSEEKPYPFADWPVMEAGEEDAPVGAEDTAAARVEVPETVEPDAKVGGVQVEEPQEPSTDGSAESSSDASEASDADSKEDSKVESDGDLAVSSAEDDTEGESKPSAESEASLEEAKKTEKLEG